MSVKKDPLHQMDTPFQGHYYMLEDHGVYTCCHCKKELFRSEHKFHSGSGWPSFDRAVDQSVRIDPSSGRGRSVFCAGCDTFIGILVKGEGFTESEQRYDINSSALLFNPD